MKYGTLRSMYRKEYAYLLVVMVVGAEVYIQLHGYVVLLVAQLHRDQATHVNCYAMSQPRSR